MSGFFLLNRAALDHPLFEGDPARLGAWVWLIGSAAWKPTRVRIKGTIVTLDRGELSFSVRFLAEKWGWSKSKVARFLDDLRAEGVIQTRSKSGTSAGHVAGQGQSIITICKYREYQDRDNPARDNDEPKSGTRAGQQRDKEEQGNKGKKEEGEGKPSPKRARKADFPRPEWAPADVWRDFLANRQRKGQPNTPTAHKRFLDDIARLSNDEWPPGRLLEHAAAQGWAGIYAPRENYDDRPKQSSPASRFPQRGASTRSLAEDVAAELSRASGTR